MLYQKITRAGAAIFLAAVLMLCGCSVKVGTNIDNNVAAKPSGGGEGMEILYGEFRGRYEFALLEYGIEDDEEENIAEACKALRKSVLDNLILEKIFLEKAKELDVYTLSEEDMSLVNGQFDSQMATYEAHYGAEEFDSMLSDCGLEREDLRQWLVNYAISAKVTDEIVSVVEYSEAEEVTDKFIEDGKRLFSEDIDKFNSGEYYKLWLPDGSRMIRHIFLSFDANTLDHIKELRESGDNDAADAFREEKAAEKRDTVDTILSELEDGMDYSLVLLSYASNTAYASLYPDGQLIYPNDSRYDEEFLEAAFSEISEVGGSARYADDKGVNLLIYVSEAKISEESLRSITDAVFSNLKGVAFDTVVEQWQTEYGYEIDYNLLRLDPQ